MTEEPKDDKAKAASTRGGSPWMRSVGPRYSQRNFASRLFPGPSEEMSRQFRQQIEGLLKPLESDTTPTGKGSVATPEDIAQVRDKLEEQNELLRAILASTVDTQTDARSTAQNSRTFAWAGTAIALLTLIATVLSIVAAINAS
ncbi:MAG TPA: hypothetical protein VHU90_08915 [Galbitalea sp.]|nr:hypothetical protein [Galbitalea sp.]